MSWSPTARLLWQSWNKDAVASIFSYLRRPRLLKPDLQVQTISDIDVNQLKAIGVRAVLLDKDNTVTAPFETEVHPTAKEVC